MHISIEPSAENIYVYTYTKQKYSVRLFQPQTLRWFTLSTTFRSKYSNTHRYSNIKSMHFRNNPSSTTTHSHTADDLCGTLFASLCLGTRHNVAVTKYNGALTSYAASLWRPKNALHTTTMGLASSHSLYNDESSSVAWCWKPTTTSGRGIRSGVGAWKGCIFAVWQPGSIADPSALPLGDASYAYTSIWRYIVGDASNTYIRVHLIRYSFGRCVGVIWCGCACNVYVRMWNACNIARRMESWHSRKTLYLN